MPSLSIIIPTHNRAEILEKCLQHLEKQTVANAIEVIVINDVQDEKFAALTAKTNWQIPIYFETIPPCQQGVARNIGVQKARASTVLFLGDDIFLEPTACAYHIARQSPPNYQPLTTSYHTATLGFTTWDTELEITPVMQWLEKSGWQFGYPKIAQYAGMLLPKTIQHLFTYTSHISLPKDIALRTPFREDISLYGWEDIEWGMRLRNNGVCMYYEPSAKGLHHHSMTMHDSLMRMETIGKSAVLLSKTVPDFDRVPHGWKLLFYKIFSMFPTMAGRHRKAFLQGCRTQLKIEN